MSGKGFDLLLFNVMIYTVPVNPASDWFGLHFDSCLRI